MRARIIGQANGSAVFVDHWRYIASDGMVVLTADEAGVHVNFRSAWFQRLALSNARMRLRGYEGDDYWYSTWSNLRTVRRDRDGDAVFMINEAGDRVPFLATIPSQMAAFTQELVDRGIAIEWVKSTYWDVYRSRRHWRAWS